MSLKILIVDDHDDFRTMVRRHIEAQHLDAVIFEASSGEIGITKALREKVNLILMDIRLPQMNGLDAAHEIKEHLPDCKIIALTMFETEAFRKAFKSDAIQDYVGKSELYDKLIPILKSFSNNKNYQGKKENAS